MIEQAIYDRCIAHPGLSALIGERVYPERLPENIIYPALVYTRISANSNEYRTHDIGPGGLSDARFQFDCYDDSSLVAKQVADQVFQAFDGYKDGCTIGYARQIGRRAFREDRLNAYRESADFMFTYAL